MLALGILKKSWAGCALWIFLFIGPVFASMVGDPVPPDRRGFSRLSLEYDQTERTVSSGNPLYSGKLRSDRLLVRADYGLAERFDLFLLAGGGDAEAPHRTFSGDPGFAFGGGGRWRLFERGALAVGAGLQIVQLFSRDKGAAAPDLSLLGIQADLGAKLTSLPFFVPYGGLIVGREEGRFGGGESARFHSQNWVGMFFGGEFEVWDGFWLTAEGKLINEYSVGLAISYRI
jgi:hypothetical protein